jgi:hypothetical protein
MFQHVCAETFAEAFFFAFALVGLRATLLNPSVPTNK